MVKAFISGCAGLHLNDAERAFFSEEQPWGLILFGRNVESPDQVRTLVGDFRACTGRPDAPVLIDQEGGRVQRLRPPHWPSFPPQQVFARLFDRDPDTARKAARLGARLIAHELLDLGITVDCLPCLDLFLPETVDAIGDRAFSADPGVVADLGRCVADGLLAGGVLPVMKHLPGHGRAQVDSHLELPVIDADLGTLTSADYKPFAALRDLPLAMTAHLLYTEIDPQTPATQSARIIRDVIRGDIEFNGCLMSDDISMKALGGDMSSRAAKTFEAGCDLVLHCNGDIDEMRAVAAVAPGLAGKSAERCENALAARPAPDRDFDAGAARDELDKMLQPVWSRAV